MTCLGKVREAYKDYRGDDLFKIQGDYDKLKKEIQQLISQEPEDVVNKSLP